jgi:uncharacterized protein (TIRG00374 family)
MATSLAPRVLRRGIEVFALISVLVFVGVLFYGNNLERFLAAMVTLHWSWVLVGLGLASLDWLGGGLRMYVLLRYLDPANATLKGCIVAAGLNAWGTLITPTQAGGAPVGIYALKRYGTPVPEGMVAHLMSFIATVLFYSVAGPTVVFLGAGRSLERHGILAGVTLRDLFQLSLGGFVTVGVVLLSLMLFPGLARRLARRLVSLLERRGGGRLANKVHALNDGIDRSHAAIVAFFRGRGWLAVGGAVLATSLTLANKLVSGYVVLRALGIRAPFVDVLLLQTLIMFLMYFAPTPGGSGLAEVLSAAVMSIYVPRALTPSYILLWRLFTSYLTIGAGSFVFYRWLGRPKRETGEEPVGREA